MRLMSDDFKNGQPIPLEYAASKADSFAPNRNPHLTWDDVPGNTRSFALLCVDPDAPSIPETVGRTDLDIPVTQPRTDFVHWVMADLPAALRVIASGSCSDGFVVRGKPTPPGPAGTRQGLNDYTHWFANNPEMSGDYYGYDGPYPPFNDLRVHRYFFRLFALDLERLPLPERFDGPALLRAIQGHVLTEAALYGTYTLNPKAQR
ncbi:YbhB/YbcL family Raf kinase inhibitor-like protein [Xylella taiwanensis]|uniref:Phosphatidylethanolamine-binding protein n=1 Tax=Xylella taiwanensis TaxID=1444770 RepID=Z9JHJ4_9GAMM|nr:YbhB/YbcL family Raf kinase inhibitor-like protein [Xylella taiwanensis]AXI83670.1 phosphatidylethanolamine-binding protein [Xylella taiwanensis]EWS77222.1 phosphatidylethanolamine-binding protein [Xylella taiwanensis]MCD8456760.1 YbhB/YbcL family Raf kinase inhibitor-like protein [Xylella taiwanensis]MCD8459170.1 YbhB/YbcL family Raf kinase inhibitor-like protein [Xylella taiwanensis]MCD8461938.1 YbhB/YbcL family Raf kinase inhibitor-like protein [Xylella taiwanensis]